MHVLYGFRTMLHDAKRIRNTYVHQGFRVCVRGGYVRMSHSSSVIILPPKHCARSYILSVLYDVWLGSVQGYSQCAHPCHPDIVCVRATCVHMSRAISGMGEPGSSRQAGTSIAPPRHRRLHTLCHLRFSYYCPTWTHASDPRGHTNPSAPSSRKTSGGSPQ